MDLLMKTSKNKSHYAYIKDFNKFIFNKAKCKNKKHFCKCCLQCFSSEIISVKHKETCFKINGKQTIKLRSGSIMQLNNVNKPSKFFRYLDANNLYGWAVNQYLPYSRFKQLNREEINRLDVNSIEENSPIGYTLEVDLEYPD